MNDLFNILKSFAPTLATAVAGPLGGPPLTPWASSLAVPFSWIASPKPIPVIQLQLKKLQS